MANKKFKVDKKSLGVVAQSALTPTPKLVAEKITEIEAAIASPKEKKNPQKRKETEVPPTRSPKRSKQTTSKELRGSKESSGEQTVQQAAQKEVASAMPKPPVQSSTFPVGPINPSAFSILPSIKGS